jgi:hypothetical protein
LAARGLVRWCTPAQDEDAPLREAVAEYLAWGRQHRGGEGAFLKAQQGRVPFAMDENSRQIAGEILGGEAAPRDRARERLHRARVFLALAEALDRQERETAAALEGLKHREQAMFNALKGDGDGDLTRPAEIPDPPPAPIFMLAERLRAWGVLACALLTEHRTEASLLVTADGQAFDLAREFLGLRDATPKGLPWASPAGTAWRAPGVTAEWERLARTPEPAEAPGGRRLEVVPLTFSRFGDALECLGGLRPKGLEGGGSFPGSGAGYLVRVHGTAL